MNKIIIAAIFILALLISCAHRPDFCNYFVGSDVQVCAYDIDRDGYIDVWQKWLYFNGEWTQLGDPIYVKRSDKNDEQHKSTR